MFNRRKLFGFAVAAPVAALALKPEKAQANNAPESSIMTLVGGNPNTMMLLKHQPKQEEKKEVSFSIGKDGHLWLQINGKWARIQTDG